MGETTGDGPKATKVLEAVTVPKDPPFNSRATADAGGSRALAAAQERGPPI